MHPQQNRELKEPQEPPPSGGAFKRVAVASDLRWDVGGGDGESRSAASEERVLVPGREREAAAAERGGDAHREAPLQEVRRGGVQGAAGEPGHAVPARLGQTERAGRRRHDVCDVCLVWPAVVSQQLDHSLIHGQEMERI